MGKSFTLGRVAKAAWRALGDSLSVQYAFGPDLIARLRDAHYGNDCATLTVQRRARLLLVDDIDRVLVGGAGDRQLDLALGAWDDLSEERDSRLLTTVVSANRSQRQLEAIPQWQRWLRRAQENGDLVEIADPQAAA